MEKTEVLFNLGSVQNSNSEAVKEGEHYKLWNPKKNGIPMRIFNFENAELCPRKGMIELQAFRVSKNVNGHRRHNTSIKIDRAYDSANNIIIGIPAGYNEKEDRPYFKTFYLEDGTVFNLANPDDAMKWAVVKNSPYVEGSPNADRSMVVFRVKDEEKEAELFIAKQEIKRKAGVIASGLFGAQLLETGLALGLNVDSMSPAVMLMRVCQIAEAEPKRFMEIWDSPNKLEISVIKRALSTGIVVEDVQFGLMYGALSLGISEALAVDYLRTNPQIRAVIDQQSKLKQNDTLKAMTADIVAPIKDAKDAELAKAKQEIEALKSQLSTTTQIKTDEIVENLTFKLEDNEYADLLAEAKRLKLQGAHKIKDTDKLRQKVADAKAKIEAKRENDASVLVEEEVENMTAQTLTVISKTPTAMRSPL